MNSLSFQWCRFAFTIFANVKMQFGSNVHLTLISFECLQVSWFTLPFNHLFKSCKNDTKFIKEDRVLPFTF